MSGDDRSSFEGYVKRLKKAGFPQQQSEALAARHVVVRDALSVPAEVEPARGKTGLQASPEKGNQAEFLRAGCREHCLLSAG